jgi:lipoprotein-anchoring transpeptidase ErfK/SrfK
MSGPSATPRTARQRLRGVVMVAVAAVTLWVTGCTGGSGDAAPSAPETTAAAPTTAPEPTTTTTAPEPPPPPPPPPPAEPTPEDIAAIQFVLGSLGYRIDGDAPGDYGGGTRNAVMAFQKLHGLERDGIAGPITREALATATPVEPRNGRHPHIEVDLTAQVAIVVDGGGAVTVLNATTGAAGTPTPVGTFEVFRQVDGWDPGPFGSLYRPKYFVGGVALHGGVPVLARPASHGCVRLPDPAVDWLWDSGVASRGTVVDVY